MQAPSVSIYLHFFLLSCSFLPLSAVSFPLLLDLKLFFLPSLCVWFVSSFLQFFSVSIIVMIIMMITSKHVSNNSSRILALPSLFSCHLLASYRSLPVDPSLIFVVSDYYKSCPLMTGLKIAKTPSCHGN